MVLFSSSLLDVMLMYSHNSNVCLGSSFIEEGQPEREQTCENPCLHLCHLRAHLVAHSCHGALRVPSAWPETSSQAVVLDSKHLGIFNQMALGTDSVVAIRPVDTGQETRMELLHPCSSGSPALPLSLGRTLGFSLGWVS